MNWWENISYRDYKVYKDIIELHKNVPQITNQDNTIIFMKNSMSGLGSQMTIFTQNSHYAYSNINSNILYIPHYSENNRQFKYHDENHANSFFIYFTLTDIYKNRLQNTNITDWNIYFCYATTWIPNYPKFDRYSFEDYYSSNNIIFYNYFKSLFQLYNTINTIKTKYNIEYTNIPEKNYNRLIGIHLRSNMHFIDEYKHNGTIIIKDILQILKERFDKLYFNNYSIFIATDVSTYIDYCKEIFIENNSIKLYYIPEIDRIESDIYDSIPLLDNKKGIKLGFDILTECELLSKCDELWLSTSNITCILEFIGRKALDSDIHYFNKPY